MATVDAAAVKKLREMTNAGIMDCKKALAENDGDFEKATAWLREKMNIRAEGKGDRATSEGLIGVAVSEDGKRGALVEVNCESDFVARNENFQNLVQTLAAAALEAGTNDLAQFNAQTLPDGSTVESFVKQSIGTIGENIVVARVSHFESQGTLGAYHHTDGKQAAIVELHADTASDRAAVSDVARDIAMQAVALKAPYLSRTDVPSHVIESEKEIYRKQASEEGKPEAMHDKIAEGRLNKFYSNDTLLEQAFIKDASGKQNVSQYVKATLGEGVQVVRFSRFKVGEGA